MKPMRFILLVVVFSLGAVSCNDESELDQYLGSYYGGFDTAQTPDPDDDLNPNECFPREENNYCEYHQNPLNHLLAKVGKNEQGQLTLNFYHTEQDYKLDRPITLSSGCGTTIEPTDDYTVFKIDKKLDETQEVASAHFPIRHKNKSLDCTFSARVSHVKDLTMDVSLQVNPVNGARAIAITVEKSRKDGDYLYVEQKKAGSFSKERIPVKLDLQTVGTDRRESRRLCAADGESKIEDKYGNRTVCVMTTRKKWSLLLPFGVDAEGNPAPGITAFWGSSRSPKWYRTSDEPDVVNYHRGIFLPVSLDETSL